MTPATRIASLIRMVAIIGALALASALVVTTVQPTLVSAQTDDDDGTGDDDDGIPDNDDDDGTGDDDDGVPDNDDDDGTGDDDDGTGDDDDGISDNDDDDGTGVRTASRLAGETRILTSIAISRSQFVSATTAYLANADGFADALSGGVLTDGPILLVPSSGDLPAETCAEITRLDPTGVVALGGSVAVSDALLAQAAAC